MDGLRGTARGHGPGNRYRSGWGQASRGESRERRRRWIRRQGRVGKKPPCGTNPVGGSARGARPVRDRPGLERCGDAKPQESHRGRTQPARRPMVQTRKTSPRPRRLRTNSSDCGIRQDGLGTPPHGFERSPGGSAEHSDALPLVAASLEGRGNVPRGVGARLKRCAEAVGTSQSSGGDESRALALNSVPHSVR
jgi:hypothetical protein